MFSNWPCSVEKEGRNREGGGGRKRRVQTQRG